MKTFYAIGRPLQVDDGIKALRERAAQAAAEHNLLLTPLEQPYVEYIGDKAIRDNAKRQGVRILDGHTERIHEQLSNSDEPTFSTEWSQRFLPGVPLVETARSNYPVKPNQVMQVGIRLGCMSCDAYPDNGILIGEFLVVKRLLGLKPPKTIPSRLNIMLGQVVIPGTVTQELFEAFGRRSIDGKSAFAHFASRYSKLRRPPRVTLGPILPLIRHIE